MMQWVLAATLTICGASVFVACSNDDNPVAPQDKPLPKVSKIYSSSVVKAERNVATQSKYLEAVNEASLKEEKAPDCFMISNGRVTAWKAYRPLKDQWC